jgi:peptidoglycan-N-acetylglucosamine deacetylase
LWVEAGAEIGNHSYSHRGLNDMPIEEYEQNILRADIELKQLLGKDGIRYFRSPMLWTGSTPQLKVQLEQFLSSHGYEQSPVTFDNSDFLFSVVYSAALDRAPVTRNLKVGAYSADRGWTPRFRRGSGGERRRRRRSGDYPSD